MLNYVSSQNTTVFFSQFMGLTSQSIGALESKGGENTMNKNE